MMPSADPPRYENHRFPDEIISHGVCLYSCVPLSHRAVQELLLERSIDVTHEAIRQRFKVLHSGPSTPAAARAWARRQACSAQSHPWPAPGAGHG
jgi:transposase-like protein